MHKKTSQVIEETAKPPSSLEDTDASNPYFPDLVSASPCQTSLELLVSFKVSANLSPLLYPLLASPTLVTPLLARPHQIQFPVTNHKRFTFWHISQFLCNGHTLSLYRGSFSFYCSYIHILGSPTCMHFDAEFRYGNLVV